MSGSLMRKACKCGAGYDVTTTDHALHVIGRLVVHGQFHCYAVTSHFKESIDVQYRRGR